MLFLARYFWAVSEKNKCPLSQESFKIKMSKAFKEYFYKKVVFKLLDRKMQVTVCVAWRKLLFVMAFSDGM